GFRTQVFCLFGKNYDFSSVQPPLLTGLQYVGIPVRERVGCWCYIGAMIFTFSFYLLIKMMPSNVYNFSH
ncbi:hypothetical protein, partial [Yersinia pestis]